MSLLRRLRDLILSIYLFNEGRGYRQLERLGRAVELGYPQEAQFLQAIRKHAADERRHHGLFERYFKDRGCVPFEISERFGYCDLIVRRLLGRRLETLEAEELVSDRELLFALCRAILITERRGLRQVDLLLRGPYFRGDPRLQAIFRVVRRDEPSHCQPYEEWLRKHSARQPSAREEWADRFIHFGLVFFKIPGLFLDPRLRRMRASPGTVASGT